MPIPSRRIVSAVSGHKKKIQSKQALKRAREMTKKWAAEDAAKKKKPKPKSKPKDVDTRTAEDAPGTIGEVYRKQREERKKKKKITTSAGTWNKGRWFNTRSV